MKTCADVRRFDLYDLVERFGSFGSRLHQLSYGIGDRPVNISRSRKSLSVEHTYAADLASVNGCLGQLPDLFQTLNQRLTVLTEGSAASGYRIHKQFVKVKFTNFQSTTMECIANGKPTIAVFRQLCSQSFLRGRGLPVRLLGLGVRFQDMTMDNPLQLSLFNE